LAIFGLFNPYKMQQRREFIKKAAIVSIGSALVTSTKGNILKVANLFPHVTPFELAPLGYNFDALEPFIDAQTMQIHYSKHHQAYVNKLNEAMEKDATMQHQSIEQLLRNMSSFAEPSKTAIKNNGGGHWNHTFFWLLLKKETFPGPKLQRAIAENFGSLDSFKKAFEKSALSVFGSGWVWLIKLPDGKLSITTTPNQDNPLMNATTPQAKPVLALDVWEHAYYLKYQNKRADYVQSFWNVVNWQRVEELYLQ
jgi:superoxide dismutase, Fe-Mn family